MADSAPGQQSSNSCFEETEINIDLSLLLVKICLQFVFAILCLHCVTQVSVFQQNIGANTGKHRYICVCGSRSVVSNSLQPQGCNSTQRNPMDCSPPGSSVHGNSPGKNAGVGCHALLQGIFPTQASNPVLPHCRWILSC